MSTGQLQPRPEPVREQLERILASGAFSGSERASAFLRYVVEQTLRNPGAPIKESTIGVEVFGKDPAFDPKADPIVRIYAGRVRERLDRYHDNEGRAAPIRIEIPKGSYVPEFRAVSAPLAAGKIHVVPDRSRRRILWKVIAAAGLIGLGVYVGWRLLKPRPARLATAHQLTFDSGLTTEPALTPDGRLLAFASNRAGHGGLDIWIRQLDGGEPIQLTTHAADDREPAFSPDGTKIAFHSTRDGGGLYVMPTLSGESKAAAQKIASGGKRPRFSPDGQWIAYWDGSSGYGVSGSVYVVAARGGLPRKLSESFGSQPVWLPDGKHLLFSGTTATRPSKSEWLIVPVNGGSVIDTGFRNQMQERGVWSESVQPIPDAWVGREVFFTTRPSPTVVPTGTDDLWKVRLEPGAWTASGITRLTQGAGQNVGVAVAPDGSIVFGGLKWARNLFALEGTNLSKLTAGGAQTFPSFSAKGDRLAYLSDRSGHPEVWIRDMSSGNERMLTERKQRLATARLSPDGTKVAYTTSSKQTFVVDIASGAEFPLCNICVSLGWSPDSDILSMTMEQNLLKIDSAFFSVSRKAEIARFAHPRNSAMAARFSPDGRWIALNVRVSDAIGVIHAVRWTGSPVPADQWIPMTEAASSAHWPEWSSDGKWVYYISNRLGSFDLWKVPAPPSGTKLSAPVLVHRFADASLNFGRRPLAFAAGPSSLVLSLEQTNGNLWHLK